MLQLIVRNIVLRLLNLPLYKVETIHLNCAKGCRTIKGAEFLTLIGQNASLATRLIQAFQLGTHKNRGA